MNTFDCPRCATPTSDEYYGPCETCRGQLRATLGNEARDVVVDEYAPKMNVTPNAVASKE